MLIRSVALATTAIAAAAETAAAATTATGTRGALFARSRDVDRELAALKFLAVEHFDRFVGFFRRGEFDESEATGFAGEFVEHQVHRSDDACLREILLQVIFHRLVREITYEESGFVVHTIGCPAQKTQWGDSAPAGSLNVLLPSLTSVFLTPTPQVLCAGGRLHQILTWSQQDFRRIESGFRLWPERP